MELKRLRAARIGRAEIIALAGFFLCLVAFFPGFMSTDSLDQYATSKSLVYTDWHPPIMAWLWSKFNVLASGPEGMLVFHLGMLWVALYLWHRHYAHNTHSWLILCVGLLPWVINFSGVLWKDVGMAFALLLMTAIGVTQRSPAKIALVVLLLFYAISVRHNAIFAAVPLVILIVSRWFGMLSRFKVCIASVGVVLAVIVAGNLFNYTFLGAVKTHSSNFMMFDDLVYLSIKENNSLIPGIPIEDIQDCATFDIGQNQLVGKPFCFAEKPSYKYNTHIDGRLKYVWLRQVAKHPIDYLGYRLAAFAYLMRSPEHAPFYVWHKGIDPNTQGLERKSNVATEGVQAAVTSVSQWAAFFFKPYWWLWIGGLLLLLSFTTEAKASAQVVRGLAASGVLYILSYVPATPLADFRYVYWGVVAISLCLAILAVDRPGLTSGSRWRKGGLIVVAIVFTAVVFNLPKRFHVNMSHHLYQSLDGSRHAIDLQPFVHDLSVSDERYAITGDDPQFIFDVRSLRLSADDVRFVGFDFSCLGEKGTPSVQLFWWGDEQTGASESQSVVKVAQLGANIFPVAERTGWKALDTIKWLRVDVDYAESCESIDVKNLWTY